MPLRNLLRNYAKFFLAQTLFASSALLLSHFRVLLLFASTSRVISVLRNINVFPLIERSFLIYTTFTNPS